MKEKGIWLPLQSGIIYGPINSRRLGSSLGINLSPTAYKLCSFNCVYCQYGPTQKLVLDAKNYKNELPTPEEVVNALEDYLKEKIDFDYITFSGNGEPTIHPDFPKIVEEVIRLRDKYCPRKKIALLTNSSGIIHKEVKDAVNLLDLPILKLDAGDELTWRRVGRPSLDLSFEDVIQGFYEVKKKVIQTLFVRGDGMNGEEEAFCQWMEKIKEVKPLEVQIYSMDRPPAESKVTTVLPKELDDMANRASRYTGVSVKAYY